jgi:hypothetical protein
MNQDRTARLCKCGCQAILLPQDSRDHASLECAERSRQRAPKSTGLASSAVGGGVWDVLPPLAPVLEFPKAWIAKAVAEDKDDSLGDEPVELLLKPAVSVAQVQWARDMVAQVPRKTQEQVARENRTSWEQLVHWAQSSTQGLPERASKRVKAKAKEPAQKPATKAPPKSTTKAASKPKAKQAR